MGEGTTIIEWGHSEYKRRHTEVALFFLFVPMAVNGAVVEGGGRLLLQPTAQHYTYFPGLTDLKQRSASACL
jgi:hypothetical protein